MGRPLTHINVDVELTQISCGSCGGTYAINERYREQCESHARCWHCPYCNKSWGYPGKTAEEKEKERHRATLARLNNEIAEKAALERKLKKVNLGVCPHCTRSFQNLARHIKSKHTRRTK